ncbi:MAG TPA: GNAT family N-acetyltransferase, partial [Bacteroidales bacterium]|nr:GNAT family N-acetyltransferase [Bacteroidales bacterium]
KCWGDDIYFKFYNDCIIHSLEKDKILPKFYLALENEDIFDIIILGALSVNSALL